MYCVIVLSMASCCHQRSCLWLTSEQKACCAILRTATIPQPNPHHTLGGGRRLGGGLLIGSDPKYSIHLLVCFLDKSLLEQKL